VTFFSSSFFGKKQERRKPGISREYKPRIFPGIQTPGISREYKPQEFPRNTNLRNFFGSYRAGKIPGTGDIQEFPRSGWVLLMWIYFLNAALWRRASCVTQPFPVSIMPVA